MKIAKLGILGVGVVTALGIAAPGFAGGNKFGPHTVGRDCGDGDTVVLNGPLTLWPPNHKFVDESITATDGPSSNPTDSVSNDTTLTITPVVTDAVGGDGGPQHDPDYTPGGSPTASGNPSATVDFDLRSERSGKGDGRTYTINWKATFDGGNKTCTSDDDGQSPFTIYVPHDMRDKANYS